MLPKTPAGSAMIPVQPHGESSGHWWLTVVVAVLVAVVFGGGAYWYVSQTAQSTQQALEQNRAQLQDQNRQLAESLSLKEQTVQQLTVEKTALESAVPKMYTDWQTYTPAFTQQQFPFTFQYPKGWTAKEIASTASKSISGKNSYCVYFSNAIGSVLHVCFRAVADATATTWNLTSMADPEIARIGVAIPFGGRTLTEKTIFGSNKAVHTVIYAQNVKDDETKFPARIKVGGFYFSAYATGSDMTAEQQVLFDQMLGSLAFTPEPTAPAVAQ